jgi:hypothetical protein
VVCVMRGLWKSCGSVDCTHLLRHHLGFSLLLFFFCLPHVVACLFLLSGFFF